MLLSPKISSNQCWVCGDFPRCMVWVLFSDIWGLDLFARRVLAFARTSSLWNCLEDSTWFHVPMIFQEALSCEMGIVKKNGLSKDHKEIICKSSDKMLPNLLFAQSFCGPTTILDNPYMMCPIDELHPRWARLFSWWFAGGLSWSCWLKPLQLLEHPKKIQEKQGKQICTWKPAFSNVWVFFQELLDLGRINDGTQRFVLEAAGSEHGILQSTMEQHLMFQ